MITITRGTDHTDLNENSAIADGKTVAAAMRPPEDDRSTPRHFRLFDLPAELVVRILKFAVVISSKRDPIEIRAKNATKIRPPAIARTCRLLRFEGVPLFYACNVFEDSGGRISIKDFWRWLHGIGLANASRINSLYMSLTDHDDTPWTFHCNRWQNMYVELLCQRRAAQEVGMSTSLAQIRMREDNMLGVRFAERQKLFYQLSFRSGKDVSGDWRSLTSFPRCRCYGGVSRCDGNDKIDCEVIDEAMDPTV